MDNWEKVYTNTDQYNIWMVRDILLDHGMNPVILNKKDTSYNFGHYELFVSKENVQKSLEIILNLPSAENF